MNAVNSLNRSGLLKTNPNGEFEPVASFEEHQQLMQARRLEEAGVQQLQQQNQQIAQSMPHQERRRAGNQLEAIEEFKQNQNMRQAPIDLSGDLQESMIFVEGANAVEEQIMGQEPAVVSASSLIEDSQQDQGERIPPRGGFQV